MTISEALKEAIELKQHRRVGRIMDKFRYQYGQTWREFMEMCARATGRPVEEVLPEVDALLYLCDEEGIRW